MNKISDNAQKHITKNIFKKYFLDKFYASVIGKLHTLNSKCILDAGCGEGFLTKIISETLPQAELKGIDISAEAIEFAKTQCPQVSFEIASVYDIKALDASYDLVICSEVLEHTEETEKALAELARVSSCKLLLTVPYEPWFWAMNICALNHLSKFGNAPGHIKHWTISSFRKILTPYFNIISIESSLPWIIVVAEPKKA